jgi:hypothetical protein
METITLDKRFELQVDFDYTPAVRTSTIDDPESLEIFSVNYDGDVLDLFEHFKSATNFEEAIKERIRETF